MAGGKRKTILPLFLLRFVQNYKADIRIFQTGLHDPTYFRVWFVSDSTHNSVHWIKPELWFSDSESALNDDRFRSKSDYSCDMYAGAENVSYRMILPCKISIVEIVSSTMLVHTYDEPELNAILLLHLIYLLIFLVFPWNIISSTLNTGLKSIIYHKWSLPSFYLYMNVCVAHIFVH